MEHDRESGTRRLQVRLARGPLRPLLRMRLDIDRWSSSSTAVELIPCGRVRPTAAYFRAGHLLLDALTRSLPRQVPSAHTRDTASRVHVTAGSVRPLPPGSPQCAAHRLAVPQARTTKLLADLIRRGLAHAELRALSWRISIHALEYSLTISPLYGEPALEYFLSFW
jgi:hypothetical protein